jgi:hypothetical protein
MINIVKVLRFFKNPDKQSGKYKNEKNPAHACVLEAKDGKEHFFA